MVLVSFWALACCGNRLELYASSSLAQVCVAIFCSFLVSPHLAISKCLCFFV